MADIATCPKCAKQLGLPAAANAMDFAECPECHAVFSLSETVQVSLPVARIVPPAEPELESIEAIARQPALDNLPAASSTTKQSVTATDLPPQQSWEERLKKALALGSSSEADSPESDEADADANDESASIPPPSFEFQLDPPPAAVDSPKPSALDIELSDSFTAELPSVPAEPVTKRTAPLTKTLADFAASAIEPAENAIPPMSEIVGNESSSVKPSTNKRLAKSLAASLDLSASQTTFATKQDEPVSTKAMEVDESTISGRRVARKGFPKVAAFAVGPVAGTLLGLYGLLWLQGDKADYLGLSHVVPASMLPATFGLTEEEGEFAEAKSLHELLSKKMQQPAAPIKRDDAVSLASATQEVAKPRVNANEFVVLVDSATKALPDFVAGDLSSQESIKRKGQAYMALCRLAEHFDFARQPGLSPSLSAKAKQAATLYLEATSDAQVRHDLAHVAGRWWEYEQRASPGIFLAGRVRETQPTDDGTLCWIKLSDSPAGLTIPVLLANGRFRTGDQVGVVGRIVAAPSGLPKEFIGEHVVSLAHGFAL